MLFLSGCMVKPVSTKKQNWEYYQIKQIKSQDSIYIIYAQRNDTLFKILSKKEEGIVKPVNKKIRKGGKYYLVLKSLFPKKILGHDILPPGGGGATGIKYDGTFVHIEPKKNIWDLFEATNLSGLYIKDDQ